MSGTVDAYLRDEVDPILRPLIDLLVKDRPHGTDSYHVSSANLDALPEIAVTHPPDTFCAVYGRA
jgi:hypothetical protein